MAGGRQGGEGTLEHTKDKTLATSRQKLKLTKRKSQHLAEACLTVMDAEQFYRVWAAESVFCVQRLIR